MVEVGLGGRLDATNILTPLVSVITSLSLDHTSLLGDTLAEIATEKGGIIKPGVPVITAPQEPGSARLRLQEIAAERGSPLEIVGQDWQYAGDNHVLTVTRSPHRGRMFPRDSTFEIALSGLFQLENAMLAIAALRPVLRALSAGHDGDDQTGIGRRAVGRPFADGARRTGLAGSIGGFSS